MNEPIVPQEEQAQEQIEEKVEEKPAKSARSNLIFAAVGIAFTLFLAIKGVSVYGSGRGYLMLFNTIRLNGLQFALIIAVFVIADAAALLSALKSKK